MAQTCREGLTVAHIVFYLCCVPAKKNIPSTSPRWSRPPREGATGRSPGPQRYPAAERSALGAAVAERAHAPVLYAELMALPSRARRRAAAAQPRFFTLGFVAHLLTESSHLEDPTDLAEHARLALEVAEHLPADRYPEALVWDFRGRACVVLARARRQVGNLSGAAAALAVAQAFLEEGTGDPLEEARLLEELAALREAQGRRLDARRLQRQARRLYLAVGETGAAR